MFANSILSTFFSFLYYRGLIFLKEILGKELGRRKSVGKIERRRVFTHQLAARML